MAFGLLFYSVHDYKLTLLEVDLASYFLSSRVLIKAIPSFLFVCLFVLEMVAWEVTHKAFFIPPSIEKGPTLCFAFFKFRIYLF